MNNNDTLREALQQCRPAVPEPITYRLYHDAQGLPLYYSMEQHDDLWIEVSCEQFHQASYRVSVIDGVLVPNPEPRYPKLRPSHNGMLCHHHDVTIVISQGSGQYWSKDE